MGQQQLLLLVLATVIVGLATVAGIQAFDENQEQATQDALVQRGVEIASEVRSAVQKPSQFGGVDLSSGTESEHKSEIADLNGWSDATAIPADGAGDGATCGLSSVGGNNDSPTATINCTTANDQVAVQVNLASSGDISSDLGYSP
jgi:hypothetical protein